MKYGVRDVFITVQGEGANSGRVAVFVRFAGCNMWNGDPADRNVGKGACATWCDTDFRASHSTKLTLPELMRKIREAGDARLVVLTGGEPCLQVDEALIVSLRSEGYAVAVETNGTVEPKFDPAEVWMCVSPKKLSTGEPPTLAVTRANELKVVLGGKIDWTESELLDLESSGRWGHRWVHPADPVNPNFVEESALRRGDRFDIGSSGEMRANITLCLDWVQDHPRWRMGFQLHKVISVP